MVIFYAHFKIGRFLQFHSGKEKYRYTSQKISFSKKDVISLTFVNFCITRLSR